MTFSPSSSLEDDVAACVYAAVAAYGRACRSDGTALRMAVENIGAKDEAKERR